MSIINCFSANTGLKIDGIVESYYAYAGENISAGDFVEFVNVYTTHPGQSNNFSLYTPSCVSSCLIDDDKFLLAYYNTASGATNRYKGVLKIGTVSSNTINFGTEYVFDNISDYSSVLSISKLDTNKFIIVYKNGYPMKAIACTISNSVITFGSSVTAISANSSNPCYDLKVIATDTTKAVALCRYGNETVKGCVLTISNNTTITVGTETNVLAKASGQDFCKLNDSNFFLVYNDTNNSKGRAIIVNVSGNNISTKGDTMFLSNGRYAGVSVCTLAENKVFIMFITQTYSVCYGIIANISNFNTITFGDMTVIENSNDVRQFGYNASALSSSKVVLAYSSGSTSETRKGLILTALISGNIISPQNTFEFSSSDTESPFILQTQNNIIILSYVTYYNGTTTRGRSRFLDCTLDTPSTDIIDSVQTYARKTTISQFNGIAKTKGVGGDQIKVYVPDI